MPVRIIRPVLLAACAALSLAACESRLPVTWLDADPVAVSPMRANRGDARATLAAVLDTTPRTPAPPASPLPALTALPAPDASLGTDALPADTAACADSWRVASSARGDVAVWWTRRPGGRVHLVAAWRDAREGADVAATGATPAARIAAAGAASDVPRGWRGPIPVDTLDVGVTDARDADRRGVAGCARPAPAVAIDARNGYVHVSYALVAPEGGGLFYAHQMDPRAAFEPPVPVLYGERLGATDVASDGDIVAVVYEDPNSLTRPRVGLAISRLAGHLFERRVLVDDGEVPAGAPHVAVRGATVAVLWEATARRAASASATTDRAPDAGDPAAAASDGRWFVRRAVVR